MHTLHKTKLQYRCILSLFSPLFSSRSLAQISHHRSNEHNHLSPFNLSWDAASVPALKKMKPVCIRNHKKKEKTKGRGGGRRNYGNRNNAKQHNVSNDLKLQDGNNQKEFVTICNFALTRVNHGLLRANPDQAAWFNI